MVNVFVAMDTSEGEILGVFASKDAAERGFYERGYDLNDERDKEVTSIEEYEVTD